MVWARRETVGNGIRAAVGHGLDVCRLHDPRPKVAAGAPLPVRPQDSKTIEDYAALMRGAFAEIPTGPQAGRVGVLAAHCGRCRRLAGMPSLTGSARCRFCTRCSRASTSTARSGSRSVATRSCAAYASSTSRRTPRGAGARLRRTRGRRGHEPNSKEIRSGPDGKASAVNEYA